MAPLGVGLIGCGNISTTYLRLARLFRDIEFRAIADLRVDVAAARAKEFDVRAETVDGLLVADDIDIVVNLTIPNAHFEVTKAILEAGKHAYSEKPFVLDAKQGLELLSLARKKNLRLGSAPDTFLGASHQKARRLIDEGAIGRVTAGTCHVLTRGMEAWHPNPDFFFVAGGGPVLDLGPYYITNLVQLLGPVAAVTATAGQAWDSRTIGVGPRRGENVPVETPTTIHALMRFASGVIVTLGTSWDVAAHRHSPMELYGTDASLSVPDPNFFGGLLEIGSRENVWESADLGDHPFAVENEAHQKSPVINRANYRCAGLADMAAAIREERPHRCSGELALHVVEVMTKILIAAECQRWIEMDTSCERPATFDAEQALALLA